jgi:hypothetical protein
MIEPDDSVDPGPAPIALPPAVSPATSVRPPPPNPPEPVVLDNCWDLIPQRN